MNLTSVRAKMVCNSTGESGQNIDRVNLGAVYSNDKSENADFATATPWGSCTLGIDRNVPAASFFKPGKKYYITFTEAPD